MLDAIMQDVRHAMRSLHSSPAFAAVAILSLALGIGANTAIFSLIDSLLLKTLPVSYPEQLLQVTMAQDEYFSNPIWENLRNRQDVFSGIFAYGMAGGRFNLAAGGEARYAHGLSASAVCSISTNIQDWLLALRQPRKASARTVSMKTKRVICGCWPIRRSSGS